MTVEMLPKIFAITIKICYGLTALWAKFNDTNVKAGSSDVVEKAQAFMCSNCVHKINLMPYHAFSSHSQSAHKMLAFSSTLPRSSMIYFTDGLTSPGWQSKASWHIGDKAESGNSGNRDVLKPMQNKLEGSVVENKELPDNGMRW